MRRILLTGASLAVLAPALAMPAVATAHHPSRQRSRAAGHRRHHRHARIVRFGAPVTAPTTAPTTPAPTTPTPAGTVASFKEGVLTITLADGSTVSGKVTERTGLDCVSEESAPAGGHDDQGGGDDQLGRLSGENGGPKFAHKSDWQGGDGQGDDQDDDQGTQAPCTTEQLVPGAKVAAAELLIGMGGSVWQEIVLID